MPASTFNARRPDIRIISQQFYPSTSDMITASGAYRAFFGLQ